LADGLRNLGIRAGDTLLVHASLRSLGRVAGGATTVVLALQEVLGPAGTIVVPTQTAYNRHPARRKPPPPEDLWPRIQATTPAFDPNTTPSRRMGRIAECVRTWPGAGRSAHPQTSFAAIGPNARYLLEPHVLTSQLDESSPLGRLEKVDARVLLLGVGFARCTAFHLAEYRLPDPPRRLNHCVLMTPDGRKWTTYDGVALDQSDFPELGAALERETDHVRVGAVGQAECRLVPLPAAVQFAEKWLLANRHREGQTGGTSTSQSSRCQPMTRAVS
jgi:aminoglycoside 3-N-acetyltransferase